MQPFIDVTGIVAALDLPNVDTDQIIPSEYLKRVQKTGFGPFLFHSWRFLEDGQINQDFELNHSGYACASILVVGRNFGSGSSREHAVWALMDYGFKVIVGTSLADIFHKNCFENGLVPALVTEIVADKIMSKAKTSPGHKMTVNLDLCEIVDDDGFQAPFVVHFDRETHEFRRHCLLNGLDEIELTLTKKDKIDAYERKHGLA
jgi:3-isopropylmalate/(R)-2-methylmalate dehydratase small subunit